MMSSIPPTTPAATGQSPATSANSATKPAALASDFETFLKMLTAQARYQDPLEPIDSSEYAAQLAQFSMVEQQVQTNDTLAALVSQMTTSNMAAMAGWVGMEARSVSAMQFDGSPISISPNPTAVADRAALVVTNSEGVEIQRLPIPVSAEPIQWAGVDEDGAPLASGLYRFSIESYQGDEMVLSEPAETYGRITEAQAHESGIVLILEGGQAVPASAVTALRQAG